MALRAFENAPADKLYPAFCSEWEQVNHELMSRDGKAEGIAGGGDNIRDTILLSAALREIRDGYFVLLRSQAHYRNSKFRHSPDEAIKEESKRQTEQLDDELILLNSQSLHRLQQPNFGMSDQRAAMAFDEKGICPEKCEGLPLADAKRILGTLIRGTVKTIDTLPVFAEVAVPYEMHKPPAPCDTTDDGNAEKKTAIKGGKLEQWREEMKRRSAHLTGALIR